MLNISNTYYETYKKNILGLEKKLLELGYEKILVDKLIESGYFLHPDGNQIRDSLHGFDLPLDNKMFDDDFQKEGNIERVHYIKSLSEALEIIEKNRKHLLDEGMMSFRGQTREYFIKRSFPNPFFNINGKERLIIPSAWRKFANMNDLLDRPIDPYTPILKSIYGDGVVYYGLDIQEIFDYNKKKYGIHSLSETGDFPEDFNKEFYKRYSQIRLGMNDYYLAALEQHYGFETCGLDITYDLPTAIFFATHEYKNILGKATYERLNDLSESIVYSFVFRAPSVRKTDFLIDSIPIFDHLKPLRPQVQNCALPYFQFDEFNGANCNFHIAFKLSEDFNFDGIPSAKDLFPSKNEDKFYERLLEMKAIDPDNYGCVPEYEF